MVVKIVHDVLVETLGADAEPISLNAVPPVPILMVGLQGSGKTTTTAKIAKRLTDRQGKRVLMASLDTRRPAAMEQLAVLGSQTGISTLPIVAGQNAVQIARRAVEAARLGGYDVVMLDTAGRTTVDDELMNEAAEVKAATQPHETLLVADALTGQDAVNTARAFEGRLDLTGIVLTRIDGDGRGGAALSMRAVTGKPIKLMGVGEKIDALEDFHPARIANRILGMGDIISLVEKAAETIDREKALAIAEKMRKGRFDLVDLREQLLQMSKLGGLGGIMGMIPGIAKMKDQIANAGLDDRMVKRQLAIIDSMTPQERANPEVLKASRKRRIAAGSGTTPEHINRLLKMHRQMADMMKVMGRGKGGPLAGMAQAMGLGGGLGGGMPSPEELKKNPPRKCQADPGNRRLVAADHAGQAGEIRRQLRHGRRQRAAQIARDAAWHFSASFFISSGDGMPPPSPPPSPIACAMPARGPRLPLPIAFIMSAMLRCILSSLLILPAWCRSRPRCASCGWP